MLIHFLVLYTSEDVTSGLLVPDQIVDLLFAHTGYKLRRSSISFSSAFRLQAQNHNMSIFVMDIKENNTCP